MSLINLLGSDAVQKQLFKILADRATKAGVKQVFINIKPDGNFDSEIPKEDSVIISKRLLKVLTDCYEQNKKK